jgi:hypothetical protein
MKDGIFAVCKGETAWKWSIHRVFGLIVGWITDLIAAIERRNSDGPTIFH